MKLKIFNGNFFSCCFVLLFITCFSISLSSPVSVYGIQIFLLFIVSTIMLLISRVSWNINSLLMYILIIFFIVLVSAIQSIYLEYQEILWLQVLRVIFWISMCFIAYPYLKNIDANIIETSLKIIIVFLSLAVYIQFIGYYAFNTVIDFSVLTGGNASRILFSTFRPSGLTAEPAIHSGIMIGLLVLLFIKNKSSSLFTIIGIVSIFLTMSIYGILSAMFFLSIYFFRRKSINLLILLLPFLVVALSLSTPILFERYELYNSGQDESNMTKFDSFNNMLNKSHLLYLGYGMTGKSDSAPKFYEGLYDVTAFGSPIIIFGIPLGFLLVSLFILFIVKLKFTLQEKLLIVLAFAKLSAPTFPFFNVFILMLVLFSQKRRLV